MSHDLLVQMAYTTHVLPNLAYAPSYTTRCQIRSEVQVKIS